MNFQKKVMYESEVRLDSTACDACKSHANFYHLGLLNFDYYNKQIKNSYTIKNATDKAKYFIVDAKTHLPR